MYVCSQRFFQSQSQIEVRCHHTPLNKRMDCLAAQEFDCDKGMGNGVAWVSIWFISLLFSYYNGEL